MPREIDAQREKNLLDLRAEFAATRVLRSDEISRVKQGDNSVFTEVKYRHPTLHEAPTQTSRIGKWTRGFPERPQDLAEWARQATMPKSVGDMPTDHLYWIDGDAQTIIAEAHASLLSQNEDALAGATDRQDILIGRELPPSSTGLIAWAPDIGWGNRTASPEARIFGWDFRPASAEYPDTGSVFMWTSDGSDNIRLFLKPRRLGLSVWDALSPLAIGLDPDGHGLRSLDPDDPDPGLNAIERALDIQATEVAAVVAWTLLAQGGIIETRHLSPERSRNKSARRKAERSRPEPDVELVTIRRSHTELVEAIGTAQDGDEDAPDARSFRWIVSGHWRSQPYGPNGSLRRPTFIAPHLKGPEGAPVRRVRDRVFLL